jgi:hypothetical protein
MRTVILTTQKTTLNIQGSESLQLEAMALPGGTAAVSPTSLSAGTHSVTVNAGVFRLVSRDPVGVTSPDGPIQVMATANDKDGTWPDPTMAMRTLRIDATALQGFVPADTSRGF